MKFKVVITEETTEIKGKKSEILTGLIMYIHALLEISVSKNTIQDIVNLAFAEENKKAETIIDSNTDFTKEKIRDLFNKLF